MEPEFWHDHWQRGQIGFHEGRTNVFLERHAAVLGPPGRVLVPLCGKTHDLLFLASRGHTVIGVELSARAVEDFFAEQQLTPTRRVVGRFEVWSVGEISIYLGNFFDLTGDVLEAPPTALYDRAAVVALPTVMRRRYADHLRALLPAGAPGLVVTFDYPQDQMEGPPFAVDATELRSLYQGISIEEIDSAIADFPRLRAVGGVGIERCFALRF